MRHHLQRCRECGRKHTALLQALVDWTGSQALNLKKREPALAHQLVLRLVRGAYLFASPLGFPSLKKHELYLLHDVIAQIIAAGAGTVLPFLPAVLREVAQDKAKYFAVPVPHE
ncbi:MAG: hypothetical protein Q8R32_02000 [bacterium]|nr:hypothetical protein [bacterium]